MPSNSLIREDREKRVDLMLATDFFPVYRHLLIGSKLCTIASTTTRGRPLS